VRFQKLGNKSGNELRTDGAVDTDHEFPRGSIAAGLQPRFDRTQIGQSVRAHRQILLAVAGQAQRSLDRVGSLIVS
jgi:hypothetical protein